MCTLWKKPEQMQETFAPELQAKSISMYQNTSHNIVCSVRKGHIE